MILMAPRVLRPIRERILSSYFISSGIFQSQSTIDRRFLDDDEMKRDLIRAFLSRHHRNIVDNVVTKDNLSYIEVKQRLLDIDHEPPTQVACSHSAHVTQFRKEKNNSSNLTKPAKAPKFKRPNSSKLKECTFCKRHFPSECKGHVWNSCVKLKERNSSMDKNSKNNFERANVPVMKVQEKDLRSSQFMPVM